MYYHVCKIILGFAYVSLQVCLFMCLYICGFLCDCMYGLYVGLFYCTFILFFVVWGIFKLQKAHIIFIQKERAIKNIFIDNTITRTICLFAF